MSTVNISWGESENGTPIHINKAVNGLACNVICMGCRGKLIANQGGKKDWYFSHYPGSTCSGESIIHSIVKHFLYTEKRPFVLPALKITATQVDIAGYVHERSVKLFDNAIILENVEKEVSVAVDLRPDCRAQILETGEVLWIEVFYANKKNEEDLIKIQRHNINCIELDVSSLTLTSSYEEFIEAIFEKSKRHWLHHSVIAYELEHLQQELEPEVALHNQRYKSELDARQKYLSALSETVTSFLQWPSLSAGSPTNEIVKTPRLKAFSNEWTELSNYWKTEALTLEKDIECDVLLGIAKQRVCEPPSLQLYKPTLLIEAHPMQDLENPCGYFLSWHNIDHWKQALEGKIQQKLAYKVRDEVTWRQRFVGLNALDQKKAALQLAGLEDAPGMSVGSFSKGWNCYAVTWKCLVIYHHMIVERYPVQLKVSELASDPLLQRVLRFARDEEASRSREIELYLWLRRLYEDGLLIDQGRQRFTLSQAPCDRARFVRQ